MTDFRPVAHFTALDTWLNDPNGLLFHDGTYHLFFQNNPFGSAPGNLSWGHATSTDLVTWHEQPVAIPCTVDEEVFSGSAVVDAGNTAGFAGPGQTALVAVYTSNWIGGSRAGTQSQSLAFSVDGGLTWTRYAGNPVLDLGMHDFRDPKVFRYDDRWVMVAVLPNERQVAIYSSTNLREWTPESRFGPAHAVEGIWECPDLFPLDLDGTTRWVLIVSLNPGSVAGGSGTQYFVGDFDGHTFTPECADWLDFGRDDYAAVSFNGVPGGRRLMIGWASNWDYAQVTPTGPWRSAMTLVRDVSLVRGPDGRARLRQWPVLPADESWSPGSDGSAAASAAPGFVVHRLTVPSGPGDRTQVVLSGDGQSRVVLTVDGDARTLTCDRTASGLTDFHPTFPSVDTAPILVGPTTDMLVVVDGCVLEIYADDGLTVLTQLVYPDAPLTRADLVPEHRLDRLTEAAEELADITAFDEAMAEAGDNIPWDQVRADLGWV